MAIGTWLLSMVQPLLGRILAALGFGVVSLVGVQAALQTLQDQMQSSVNAMPAEMLQLFLYGGGGQALGIIMGACATRVLIWQAQAATKILGVAGA